MSSTFNLAKGLNTAQQQRFLSRLAAIQVEVLEENILKPLSAVALENLIKFAAEEDCSLTFSASENHVKEESSKTFQVNFTGLSSIIKLQADELLLTTQTGALIADLQSHLRESGLRLPLNWPKGTRLIDALATNQTGFSNYQHHHELAHWVTGIEAVNAKGEFLQYGGEVMKNVTGYDLTRLFCGSHHQFGIMTQATLKLMPLPKNEHLSLWHFDNLETALGFVRQINPRTINGLEITALFKVKPLFGYKLLIKLTGETDDIKNVLTQLNQVYDSRPKSLPVEELPLEQEADWVEKLYWPALPKQLGPSTPHSAVFFNVAIPYASACQIDLWLTSGSDVLDKSDWVWNIAQDEFYFRIQKQADFPLQAAQTLRHLFEVKGGVVWPLSYPNEDWANALSDQLLTPFDPIELKWLEKMKSQWDPKAVLPFAPTLKF